MFYLIHTYLLVTCSVTNMANKAVPSGTLKSKGDEDINHTGTKTSFVCSVSFCPTRSATQKGNLISYLLRILSVN